LSKIADERAKLTANVLNASAAGVFVTGVIAPLVAAFYGIAGPSDASLRSIVVATLIWVSVAVGLHLLALAVLGRLSE
jgi:hypothetical protein